MTSMRKWIWLVALVGCDSAAIDGDEPPKHDNERRTSLVPQLGGLEAHENVNDP